MTDNALLLERIKLRHALETSALALLLAVAFAGLIFGNWFGRVISGLLTWLLMTAFMAASQRQSNELKAMEHYVPLVGHNLNQPKGNT